LVLLEEVRRRFDALAATHRHRAEFLPITSINGMLMSLGPRLRSPKLRNDLAAEVRRNCDTPGAQFTESQRAAAEGALQAALPAVDAMDVSRLSVDELDRLAADIGALRDHLASFTPKTVPEVPDARMTLENALDAIDRHAARNPEFGKGRGLFGVFSRNALSAGTAKARENLRKYVTDANPLGHFELGPGAVAEFTTGMAFGLKTVAKHGEEVLSEELVNNADIDALCTTLQARIDAIAINDTVPFAAALDQQLAALSRRIDQQRSVAPD